MPTPKLSSDVLKETVATWEKEGRQTGRAAKALGINETSMRNRLKRARERFGSLDGSTPPDAVTAGKGRSLSEFRETHDKGFIVPKKVRAALVVLGAGWEYEMQFSKLAGVSLGDLSAYRAMFEDHIVVVEKSKRAWAGTEATAEKMRAML